MIDSYQKNPANVAPKIFGTIDFLLEVNGVPNIQPIADAGDGATVHPGTQVTLDGSGSHDPDANYPLTYAWNIISQPDGSAATLSNAESPHPSLPHTY